MSWTYQSLYSYLNCRRKLLWSRLRAAFVYGYDDNKYLEGSLTPCPVSQTTVVTSPRACDLHIHEFLSMFVVPGMNALLWSWMAVTVAIVSSLSSLWAYLNWKVVSVAHRIHSWVKFFMTVLQAAWLTTSSTVKASQQGGSIQLASCSVPDDFSIPWN